MSWGCIAACCACAYAGGTPSPDVSASGATSPPPAPPMPLGTAPLPPANFSGGPNAPLSVLRSTSKTNSAVETSTNKVLKVYAQRLANAEQLVEDHDLKLAKLRLVDLLARDVPDEIQRSALLALASLAQKEDDLPRAQSIYAQFFNRWSDDYRVPEVLLRQGKIFREMGLNELALAKFYSVMTAALSLKQNQMGYYKKLVLEAQIEIAQTNYRSGKYTDAAQFYSRLLKSADSSLDLARVQFLLIRSLVAAKKYARAAAQAQDYLAHYPLTQQAPEVRYYLADSFKGEGRDAAALQQVLLFLKQEKAQAKEHPKAWAYWQQRVGNEIGNQLYREGDYVKALAVYQCLAKLNKAPVWHLPVDYQVGLTYERLLQPDMAKAVYQKIIKAESSLGTNVPPSLQTVLTMARWRIHFINWQQKAESENRSLAIALPTNSLTNSENSGNQ